MESLGILVSNANLKKKKLHKTNKKGPIRIWVGREFIIPFINLLYGKRSGTKLVPELLMLITYEGHRVYIPNPSKT